MVPDSSFFNDKQVNFQVFIIFEISEMFLISNFQNNFISIFTKITINVEARNWTRKSWHELWWISFTKINLGHHPSCPDFSRIAKKNHIEPGSPEFSQNGIDIVMQIASCSSNFDLIFCEILK